MEFLSCRVRSSFPEQGVTSHIFTLCRGALLYPWEILSLLPTGRIFPVHTSYGIGPSIRPKPITALLHHPVYPPFCIQRAFGLAQHGDLIWPMTMIQSIIDPKCTNLPFRTGELTASQPTGDQRYPQPGTRHPLMCERKKIQLTSPEPL